MYTDSDGKLALIHHGPHTSHKGPPVAALKDVNQAPCCVESANGFCKSPYNCLVEKNNSNHHYFNVAVVCSHFAFVIESLALFWSVRKD